MEVPQNIGKYQIKYLISTLLERRLFLANDPEGNNVIIKESLNNQNEQLKQEFEILAKLNHPNIIKPIELITLNDKYYLILPRAENDLFEYMKSQTISDQTIHQIMHSLLSAVQYLNVLGIWHRNICPENILIFNNNNEKRFVLADFKNAINYTGTKNDEFRTKYQYMAPEISTNKGCMIFFFFEFKMKIIQKVFLNFFYFEFENKSCFNLY